MATKRSHFEVPEWEDIDANTEHLSKTVFQRIPFTTGSKSRKTVKRDRRQNEDKKEEIPSKKGDSLWSKDYDDYFYSLDPGERLTVLFRKLENGRNKDKSVGDFTNDRKAEKGRKIKELKRKHAGDVATIGNVSPKDLVDVGKEGSKTAINNEGRSIKEASKMKVRKQKKKSKQIKANISDKESLNAQDCEVLNVEQPFTVKVNVNSEEMHFDQTKTKKMKKRNKDANIDNFIGIKTPESPGSECGSDSSNEPKNLQGKKHEEKVRQMEEIDLCTNVHQSTSNLSISLDRREQVSKVHAASICTSKTKKDFKSKLQKKLNGAQFRWINQQLYTLSSNSALDMFSNDPTLFDVYHKGFQSQVQSWPQNPIDLIIKDLRTRSDELIVADMGCGEAKIAQNVKQKVYSFDLVAQNSFTTACDMSQVPLDNESVDMVIFCLSLMGKNIADFLMEANRILKIGGVLKIAEVVSRFDGVDKFIENVSTFGFSFLSKDAKNKMFILMDFRKIEQPSSNVYAEICLKPCLYKKR